MDFRDACLIGGGLDMMVSDNELTFSVLPQQSSCHEGMMKLINISFSSRYAILFSQHILISDKPYHTVLL